MIQKHRISMKTRNLLSINVITLSTCLLLGLNATVQAQNAAFAPQRQASVAGFDIEIADGVFTHKGETVDATLENVVDMLRDQHPEANIIVAPEVPPILIETLKIRATDLGMELEALHVASGRRFNVVGSGSRESPLYVLEAAPEGQRAQLRVEAFSLSGYFASLPKTGDEDEDEAVIARKIHELERMVDETVDIYRAIDEDVSGRSSARRTVLNMRFHRGANLVILIGDPRSIEIAGKVIGALPHAQRSGRTMGRYGEFDGGYGAGDFDATPSSFITRGRGRGAGNDPFSGGGGMSGGGTYGAETDVPPANTVQPPVIR